MLIRLPKRRRSEVNDARLSGGSDCPSVDAGWHFFVAAFKANRVADCRLRDTEIRADSPRLKSRRRRYFSAVGTAP
jgi:hypothetical protein